MRRQLVAPPAPYDYLLIVYVLALLLMGLLMVTSASINVSGGTQSRPFDNFQIALFFLTASCIQIGTPLGARVGQTARD